MVWCRLSLLGCSLFLALSCGESKVIRGVASSQTAWEEKGQFIAKFCFHGELQRPLTYFMYILLFADKQARFRYSINASSGQGGKLYVYLDETWSYVNAETDCARRIAMAKFSSEW